MTEVRRYLVFGRVQGVGFRAFVWRAATELGLKGWVRNRFDGSVEVLAAAPGDLHETLLERLNSGPRLSRVDRVEAEDAEPGGESFSGFSVRPDA